MEIIELVDKLWQVPSKEYLYVNDVDGKKLYKVPSFDLLFEYLNIQVTKETLYIHPIVVLAAALTTKGIFKYDDTPNSRNQQPKSLAIAKVSINKYQKINYKNGKLIKELNLPQVITPETIRTMNYDDIVIDRPPQLRKILLEYFGILNIDVNICDLEMSLIRLNSSNPIYEYKDADEIFFESTSLIKNTMFEFCPKELIDIIRVYINEDYYLDENIIFGKVRAKQYKSSFLSIFDSISTAMGHQMAAGEDNDIMSVLNEMDINQIVTDNKDKTDNNMDLVSLLGQITEDYGIGNVISSIGDNITNGNA
jgi:hypothetical protein